MRVYTTDEFMKSSKRFHIFKGSVPNHADRPDMPHTHEFIEIAYILSGIMKATALWLILCLTERPTSPHDKL